MLAREVEATHLVGLSPTVVRVSLEAYRDCRLPKLFAGGDRDFAFDPERFQQEFATLPEPKRFVALSGSDHFFRLEEERVYRAVQDFLLGGRPPHEAV